MEAPLFGIPNLDIYIVFGILIVFSTIEALSGYLENSRRSRDDWWLEGVAFVMLGALIKPVVTAVGLLLCYWFFPGFENYFAGLHFGWALLLFLLVDDFMQYWYHRFAHEYETMWKWHRPHHAAEEMGFLVSYRNSFLYYLFIPNLWWLAIALFLGFAKAAAVGVILKQIVIIGSHSPTRWDRFLYRYEWLHPVAWVVERILVTPATHFAHHGKSMADGISDPNGNFGNMLFIWDQLFGTAIITRQYPTELGLPNDPKDPWAAHLFYPLITSPRAGSEISEGFVKSDTRRLEPETVELEAGKYLWCRCGFSKTQPFCDGSHHGTKFKPLLFELEKPKKVRLCNCKASQVGPFCDNTHVKLGEES